MRSHSTAGPQPGFSCPQIGIQNYSMTSSCQARASQVRSDYGTLFVVLVVIGAICVVIIVLGLLYNCWQRRLPKLKHVVSVGGRWGRGPGLGVVQVEWECLARSIIWRLSVLISGGLAVVILGWGTAGEAICPVPASQLPLCQGTSPTHRGPPWH